RTRVHPDLLELELPAEWRLGSVAREGKAMTLGSLVARVLDPCRAAHLGTGWKPVLQVMLILTLFSDVTRALTVSLPLDGYYRPAAYLPLAVNSATAVSDGASSDVVTNSPPLAGVLPVYIASSTADRIGAGDQS